MTVHRVHIAEYLEYIRDQPKRYVEISNDEPTRFHRRLYKAYKRRGGTTWRFRKMENGVRVVKK